MPLSLEVCSCGKPRFPCVSLITDRTSYVCTWCGELSGEIVLPGILKLHNGLKEYSMIVYRGNLKSIRSYMNKAVFMSKYMMDITNKALILVCELGCKGRRLVGVPNIGNYLTVTEDSSKIRTIRLSLSEDLPMGKVIYSGMVETPRKVIRIAYLRSRKPFSTRLRRGYPNNILGVFWMPMPYLDEMVCRNMDDIELGNYPAIAGDLDKVRSLYPESSAYGSLSSLSGGEKLCELLHYKYDHDPERAPEVSVVKFFGSKVVLSLITGAKLTITPEFHSLFIAWLYKRSPPGIILVYKTNCIWMNDSKRRYSSMLTTQGNYVYRGSPDYLGQSMSQFLKLFRECIKDSDYSVFLSMVIINKDDWISGGSTKTTE